MKTCTKCKLPRADKKCLRCVAKYQREWYEKNKNKCKIKRSQRYQDNKDKERQNVKNYLSKNPHKIKQYNLKSKWGLSVEAFNAMVSTQQNKCAVCSAEFTKTNLACLDHCHSTNKLRGLLCSNCNRGIGLLKESESTLSSAISYLRRYK